jgi:SAM-dependent methyltransferase
VSEATYDREFWERRWAEVLREHPEAVASRRPNAHLLGEIADTEPGSALDAGCGHGAEAIWLASSGWTVTAVDFSATALEQGRSTSETIGADVAGRITWVEGDLGSWAPAPRSFDLVSCLYVHVAGSVGELVTRLGAGVAPAGTPGPGRAPARGPGDRRFDPGRRSGAGHRRGSARGPRPVRVGDPRGRGAAARRRRKRRGRGGTRRTTGLARGRRLGARTSAPTASGEGPP